MSGSLAIEISAEPIERARADVAMIAFCENERPLRGSAGRVDWRLCGRLSRLIANGMLTGSLGEAVLIASGGGLRVPRLIALGVGPRDGFDASACSALAQDAVRRGVALRVSSIVLGLPGGGTGALTDEDCAAGFARGAAAGLAGAGDLLLRVSVPPDEADRSLGALRAAWPRGLPESITLRSPGPAARQMRASRSTQRTASLPASPAIK